MPSTFDESLEGAMDKLDQGKKASFNSPLKSIFPPGIRVYLAGLLALLFDGNNWVK